MIRLGLRLALAGGREAVIRLAVTAAAVALGVMMLLAALAGINAVNAQNARYAWISTAAEFSHPSAQTQAADAAAPARDPLWFQLNTGFVDGQLYGRVDVAATGPDGPVLPGIARTPGPGQYYASPALTRLLRHQPANQLADRFPGVLVGTIGPAALPSPKAMS